MNPASPWGERLADYELLQELGEGGMGTVFVGKHRHQSGLVAIKVAKPEVLDAAGGPGAFWQEVRTASGLHHPNIVKIYNSGRAPDGRVFLVMQLLERGPLSDPENRGPRRDDPRRALALMLPIARAVQFAHERLVLHCDLKPENILLDAAGVPHVSDFGLARVIGKPGSTYRGEVQGGTPGWMSPEQMERRDLTAASDVFSLGAILHWLLTAELPFGAGADFLARVAAGLPPARWSWSHGPAWALREIAAKALASQPERRYPTAAALAQDLESVATGRPLSLERHLPARRACKWIRRHPLASAAAVQALLLLLYIALIPISVLREVRAVIRDSNGFGAVAQAGAVANELNAYLTRVVALARDPEVRALVDHPDLSATPAALVARASGFDSVSVFDGKGELRARVPHVERFPLRNFAFRDYFRAHQRPDLARPGDPPAALGYVSRVFRSPTDGLFYIGVSAPLFDDHGRFAGVILATTLARATFGAVQMNCAGHGDCMTALLGARDRDREGEPLPDRLNVVAEPGLANGEDTALDAPASRRICQRVGCTPASPGSQFQRGGTPRPIILDDYEDPVLHTRALAAVAPVANTGLVVVVATPDGAANGLVQRMMDRLTTYLWIPIVPGVLFLFARLGGARLAGRTKSRHRSA